MSRRNYCRNTPGLRAASAAAGAVAAAVRAAVSLPAYSVGDFMSDSIALWHAEHKHFARLLDLLEQQVVAFHADDGPNYELMLDVVSYLRYFPDRYHHPREDVAFARLVKRDPAMKPLIEKTLQ